MHKMRYVRFAVAALVLLAVFFAMQGHVVVGTLCMLCPVGFLETSVASGSVPWGLLPGVLILLAVVFLVGRVFCSWLCPTGALKNLLGGRRPRGVAGRTGERSCAACPSCAEGGRPASRSKSNLLAQGIVLAVLLAVSFVVKFPVFCLLCPIGLAFGTLYAISRVFVLWQPGWELVVFPLMLLAEVFLFKRWCSSICPLGFFFGLMTRLRSRLGFAVAPQSKSASCRAGEGCVACSTVCPENIDASSEDPRDFEDCTLCLDCVENCPTKSLGLKLAKTPRPCGEDGAGEAPKES